MFAAPACVFHACSDPVKWLGCACATVNCAPIQTELRSDLLPECQSLTLPTPHLPCTYSTSIQQVGFKYPKAEKNTLSEVSIYITLSSRVAVLGANGAGKSTMIKLLTGELEAGEGNVWKHPNLRIAYVAQVRAALGWAVLLAGWLAWSCLDSVRRLVVDCHAVERLLGVLAWQVTSCAVAARAAHTARVLARP